MNGYFHRINRAYILSLVFFLPGFLPSEIRGQGIQFTRLNTSNGLSDNLVNDACRDKNGLIWIATANGLNSFNGFAVKAWHEFTDQVFETRDIRGLSVDNQNRLWILDADGRAAIMDAQKKITKVEFPAKPDSGAVRFLMPDQQGNMGLLVGSKYIKTEGTSGKMKVCRVFPDSVMKRVFSQVALQADGKYLMLGSGRVVLMDPETYEISAFGKVRKAYGGALLPDGNFLVSTGEDKELFRIDPATMEVRENYGLHNDQEGKEINGYFRQMNRQADGKIIITSGYDGFMIFDPQTEKISRWVHDPLDVSSIVSNNTYRVITDNDGFVFITSRTAGLGFYNCFSQLANTRKFFSDVKGERIFDGFVGSIGQNGKGEFFLGSQGGLMRWKPGTGKVDFYPYGIINGKSIAGREEIRALCFDKQGRLWVGLNRYGIVLLDQAMKPVKYFNSGTEDLNLKIPSNFIISITQGPGDLLWVGTSVGLCLIDPMLQKVVKPAFNSALAKLGRTRTGPFYVKSADEIWMATYKGAYRYLKSENRVDSFNEKMGLSSNLLLSIGGDSLGNIYAGSRKGLQIIDKKGRIAEFSLKDQLPEESCVAMVTDLKGNLWIASDNYLTCIFPGKDSLRVFGKSYGFHGNGFRFNVAFCAKDGRLFFGCNEGVSWFLPDDLLGTKIPYSLEIFSMKAGRKNYYFSGDAEVEIPDFNNSVTFEIMPVSAYGDPSNKVQYRLSGLTEKWASWEPGQAVYFNGLKPGKYTLSLRWSQNGKVWHPANNQVTITVASHWWQKGWVKLGGILLLAGLLGGFWENQKRKIEAKKEADEIERAILYLSSTIHSHSDIDNLLWDVAKHVISKMGLEDCVIYLLDERRNVLVQKAAFGPKSQQQENIKDPIEIPLGKGIVGSVAKSGIAEIIPDTTHDPRYIKDDIHRFSEISVPIMDGGKVLGVIDSEHREKNHFRQRHLTILQTVSSLLGSKIVKARAEAEKNATELALNELKRKSAEVEMQALRAQMNPHFLFNSLNSINNFILNSDIENASAYLTRFSRLMRLILDNSRHDWVPLAHELHALELYIGMESLRFDRAFSWHIKIAEGIEKETILIPPLLIQPYVENAIWHGLMHRKSPGGHLQVSLVKSEDELMIEIEDNGVGRAAAALAKLQSGGHKKSHGMNITSERIEMINEVYKAGVKLEILDKTDENNLPAGTLVRLRMRFLFQHQNRF